MLGAMACMKNVEGAGNINLLDKTFVITTPKEKII
jgi:hypothetical protein